MTANFKKGVVYAFLFGIFFYPGIYNFHIEAQMEKQYRFTEVFTIGVEEAKKEEDQPYQFYNIMSVDCDKEGYIYVLDFTGNCVKKFDSSGKFIKKLFRKGKGPNEISNPIAIGVNKFNNHLFVVQDFGFTMKEFDLEGSYIKYYVLPVRVGTLIRFLGNDKCVCLNSIPKNESFYNVRVFNFKKKAIIKELAPVKMPYELNLKQYFDIMDETVLWTSRGNGMKLLAFNLNTGEKEREIGFPGKYKKNKFLEINVTKDSKMVHPILYNIAQPFVINDELFVLVINQEYKEIDGKVEKYPYASKRSIYHWEARKRGFIRIGSVEKSDGMYVAAVSDNKLILYSNDPNGRIKVLEFKKK